MTDAHRYSRQILAFGEEGQRAIEQQIVGIVGLGGLGSQVCQALTYLGARRFVLVDDDRVEDTNLNRLVGAVPADATEKRLKTEVAERLICSVNPGADVLGIPNNLRTLKALEALAGCSVIFGCVDHDGPRLVLMELACAYKITLLDCASDIAPGTERNRVVDFGGRIVICRPGDFCLVCAQELDIQRAKAELESPEVQALRKKHGYGLGDQVPAPAVVSLNGIIANLAVTEFLVMVTGIREPVRKRVFQGMRGVMLENRDVGKPDCFNCGYLVGQREKANVFRYVLPIES